MEDYQLDGQLAEHSNYIAELRQYVVIYRLSVHQEAFCAIPMEKEYFLQLLVLLLCFLKYKKNLIELLENLKVLHYLTR